MHRGIVPFVLMAINSHFTLARSASYLQVSDISHQCGSLLYLFPSPKCRGKLPPQTLAAVKCPWIFSQVASLRFSGRASRLNGGSARPICQVHCMGSRWASSDHTFKWIVDDKDALPGGSGLLWRRHRLNIPHVESCPASSTNKALQSE